MLVGRSLKVHSRLPSRCRSERNRCPCSKCTYKFQHCEVPSSHLLLATWRPRREKRKKDASCNFRSRLMLLKGQDFVVLVSAQVEICTISPSTIDSRYHCACFPKKQPTNAPATCRQRAKDISVPAVEETRSQIGIQCQPGYFWGKRTENDTERPLCIWD